MAGADSGLVIVLTIVAFLVGLILKNSSHIFYQPNVEAYAPPLFDQQMHLIIESYQKRRIVLCLPNWAMLRNFKASLCLVMIMRNLILMVRIIWMTLISIHRSAQCCQRCSL